MGETTNRRDLAGLILVALRDLGGKGHSREIRDAVIRQGRFTKEQVEAPGPLSSPTRSRLSHGIDWALQSLKSKGFVKNDGGRPATWSLTAKGRRADDAELNELFITSR